MSLLVLVAVLVILAVMGSFELYWRQRRHAAHDRMMAEWADANKRIHDVLHYPGRAEVINDVVLRAKAQQAQLDHLCSVTASAMQAPAAVITVVEVNGQRWLAHFGAEWCPGDIRAGLIAPLETSYCKYVVARDETLVIVDSLVDVRVRHDDGETLHAVRAYIGAPVHTADGIPVGSLCVFDTKPRKWTERDRKVVESFASLVAL